MANILNIDTSGTICSVALSIDGEIVVGLESANEMDHSTSLAPFVKQCFNYLGEKDLKLNAVSVTIGPGSYTGLRIGLSMAKGIAFGEEIPLIALSTLEVMAVRAIFSFEGFTGEELIVPMIDARRMEVYTGVYRSDLSLVLQDQAMILNKSSLKESIGANKIIFIGNGTEKFKEIKEKKDEDIWLGSEMSHAKYMTALSEKYYKEKKFSDVAYTTPQYLKEYQATTPKNKL